MPKLVVESGTGAGNSFTLDRAMMGIGRSVSNAIQIVDRRMSRNHVEIHMENGRVILCDLGSKNGTLLNGILTRIPTDLRNNDRIQVGDTILRYESDDLPGAPGQTTGVSDDSHPSSSVTGTHNAMTKDKPIQSAFRVVDEQQWGATRGERRAGYNPDDASSLDGTSILDVKNPTRRLEIIYQVIDAIRSVFELNDLLDRIMTIIQTVLHPDRTYLLMINPTTGEMEPQVVKVVKGENPNEVKLSSSIVNRCVTEGVSLLVSDAMIDDRFNNAASIIMNAIRTAMVAPLIFKGDSIGVIYVDCQSRLTAFSEDELDLLTSIANQAAVAITNARLQSQLLEQHKMAREMEIARNIQTNLLPKNYPDLPGYQLSAMSLPAKHVGGDYYDFLPLPDGRLGLAIADVSGKGVPAAILTASTRSYLQGETQHPNSSLASTVSRINRMVHRDVTNDMYVTMVMTALDSVTGELEYVNAGHAHPVVLNPDGNILTLSEGGIFLGIDDSAPYDTGKTVIEPNGVLVLYTDGVTDILSPEGKPFTSERFLKLLVEKHNLTAEEIRNAIYQACLTHRGSADQFDDFTLIVLKRVDLNESEID